MKSKNNIKTPGIFLFWSLPSVSMVKAYKQKCNQLNQAIRKLSCVEIITIENEILKLMEIGIESGSYFGLKNIKGHMQKILLNVNHIKHIVLL